MQGRGITFLAPLGYWPAGLPKEHHRRRWPGKSQWVENFNFLVLAVVEVCIQIHWLFCLLSHLCVLRS